MDFLEKYRSFTRPALADMLEILGLQYQFESASGDVMRGKNHKGEVTDVIDFLGGYGSTILGHNHPQVLQAVNELSNQKAVFHSQASIRTKTAELAFLLNNVIREQTQDGRKFFMTAANSGAEAVEIALKHALLEWHNKKQNFILDIKTQFFQLKNIPEAVRQGFQSYIQKLEESEPIVFAFRGGFHGKTAAAVTVTENPAYSSMYSRKTLEVCFLDRETPESNIQNLIAEFELPLKTPLGEVTFSRVVGLIFEPIQGEGGIYPLSPNLLKTLQVHLKTKRIPLIADEIQSGLYRTGEFLSSTRLGLQPDYILLGKSLGGGVSKLAVALIADDHYQQDFGWVHTSTFAEDDWSSRVAIQVVQTLQGIKSEIKSKADHFESRIRKVGEELIRQYPNIVKSVRGHGFFLGLEFNFQDKTAHSSFLHFVYENGYATYLFTSYLLHHHKVRVGVTMSAPSTLRFEPSIFISDEAVDKLQQGLFDLCQVLSERRMAHLLSHLWTQEAQESGPSLVSDSATPRVSSSNNLRRIGFLSHVINTDWLRSMERAFTHVQNDDLEKFLKLYMRNSSPALYHEQIIEGFNGEKVILNLYGLMTSSQQFENDLRNKTRYTLHKVQEAVDLAAHDGCQYFGLGQFTSIVSGNGTLLNSVIPLTTGNSLTAGMAFRALQKIIHDRFQSKPDLKIGVVGFTGNICLVVTQLLADLNFPMTLVYREPYSTSDRFKAAVQTLLATSQVTMEQLTFAHQIDAIKDCDVILVGTNSSKEFILSEHVKSGAVILDISVPTNVHSEVRKRNDVLYFQGGFARFPFDQKIGHSWAPTFGSKNWYACMSETLVCGLLDVKESFSIGPLSKERVVQSLQLADQVGVELGDLRRV